jgi:phosphatidylglycerophosphate synthase
MRATLPRRIPCGYDGLVIPALRVVFGRWRHVNGTYDEWVGRVPNQLVWHRVFCSAPIVALLAAAWAVQNGLLAWISLALVVSLLVTDAIDGPLARETNNVTGTGARWDPIADKVLGFSMVLAILWLLWLKYAFAPGAVVIMALIGGRAIVDVGLSGLAWLEERRGLHPKASVAGKYKVNADALWMGAALWDIWFHRSPGVAQWPGFLLLVGAATLLGLWSLSDHARNLTHGQPR